MGSVSISNKKRIFSGLVSNQAGACYCYLTSGSEVAAGSTYIDRRGREV
jgi:hypothetical protein